MIRYAFDDFCLDEAAHTLSRSGVPIALTPRVFDTLLHLLVRAGELVDKNELMQAVWPSRVVEENNLNQAVSALRRALGEARGGHHYILTVPGRGYRFVAPVRALPLADAASSVRPLRTLAVLPFKLLQPGPDEALQTGMADTLITRLNGLDGLVVRPLAAVSRFGAQQHDAVDVGRRLGVDAVLEGTIQQAAARVRVSMRLFNVAEGRQQWADIFDTRLDDLFALQDAVAEKAAAALALRLTLTAQPGWWPGLMPSRVAAAKRWSGSMHCWNTRGIATCRPTTSLRSMPGSAMPNSFSCGWSVAARITRVIWIR